MPRRYRKKCALFVALAFLCLGPASLLDFEGTARAVEARIALAPAPGFSHLQPGNALDRIPESQVSPLSWLAPHSLEAGLKRKRVSLWTRGSRFLGRFEARVSQPLRC